MVSSVQPAASFASVLMRSSRCENATDVKNEPEVVKQFIFATLWPVLEHQRETLPYMPAATVFPSDENATEEMHLRVSIVRQLGSRSTIVELNGILLDRWTLDVLIMNRTRDHFN